MYMKELLNKVISGLKVSQDQCYLLFEHPNGASTMYVAYGTCCSETWFADIIGVEALLGATVTNVEAVPMESVEDGRSRQEHDEFYGVKLTTTKGYVDIVYRNSSNGYYGGYIELADKVYGEQSFKNIMSDWSA